MANETIARFQIIFIRPLSMHSISAFSLCVCVLVSGTLWHLTFGSNQFVCSYCDHLINGMRFCVTPLNHLYLTFDSNNFGRKPARASERLYAVNSDNVNQLSPRLVMNFDPKAFVMLMMMMMAARIESINILTKLMISLICLLSI